MKFLFMVLMIVALQGCVSVEKVVSGELKVGDRMTIQIEGPWNRISAPNMGPAQSWTMEGLPVDQLLLYSGIADSVVVHAESGAGQPDSMKSFAFRSSMQPEEIVTMFEGMLTRDGSRFTLTKLEPSSFGGLKGFRFTYRLVRKTSNVNLLGVGYGAVSKGELFSVLYMAPRLAFYDRHVGAVEKIAASARITER